VYYQIDVKPQEVNTSKVAFVRAIRTLSPSIRLKDAIEIYSNISNHRCTLVAGISLDVGTFIQTTFAKIGVEVEVNESSIQSPMLFVPNVDSKWKWGFLGIKKAI